MYSREMAQHNALVGLLESKEARLQDLHVVLKLIKTLAVIEKYQNENRPSKKPIETVIDRYNKAGNKLEAEGSK